MSMIQIMEAPKADAAEAKLESRPKLLIMIPTEGHGGCEYNALTVGVELQEAYGFDVIVSFPLNDTLSFLAGLAETNGLRYEPLNAAFVRSDNDEAAQAHERAAWEVLDKIKPDVVFIPYPWPKRGQGLASACAALGVPTLVKFALVPEDWSDAEFVYKPLLHSIEERQIWFANSRYSSELLEKHFKLRPHAVDYFHVGPIGVRRLMKVEDAPADAQKTTRAERLGIPDLADDEIVLTTVSRMSRQKGYPYLLDAVAKLAPRYPKLRFVWVGDGEIREEMEAKVAERGLEDRIYILGFRSDVRQILKVSDIFVLPTVYEGGCSQVLLEAMEEGLPCVATRTSAVDEVVTDGKDGLLARVEDADDLAQKIEMAVKSGRLREDLAKNALETVAGFSAEVMFQNTVRRLEKLMGRRLPKTTEAPAAQSRRTAIVALEGEDAHLQFNGSEYVYGFTPRLGEEGRLDSLWMRSAGAFNIEDAACAKVGMLFLTGGAAVSRQAVEDLNVWINDVQLECERSFDANSGQWRVKAFVPPEARGTFKTPMHVRLSTSDERPARDALLGATTSEPVSMIFRKFAFSLK